MSNKKVIVGVAAGVALLTAAGILLYNRKKSKKDRFIDEAEHLAENFKSKLNSLQRKAQKEFKNTANTGEDLANVAVERVNQWLGK
ncbi:LPXTG cell wall anchor domain-containing protein [Flavobacterium sp. PLA-1-15]|uniref:LPXTG cell wall anchor domain-containing protein n=1 Tax=Flavobacterium sp. PLA-1-15 TaxID=3380533 RepID=UPI003B8233F2